MVKSSFYYEGHYQSVASKIKEWLNSIDQVVSKRSLDSPRAVGDAIEDLIAENFEGFLGNWCENYSDSFARRAMADLAFTDREGFYSIVDVKTHREDTKFNMPNLTSVERLSRFYESNENVFSLLMTKYLVKDSRIDVSKVVFVPIEFLSWDCLTIGALGWGQIQIANSNNILINDGYSRKNWMLELCETLFEYYPKEILKTQKRVTHFERVKEHWELQEDIWI